MVAGSSATPARIATGRTAMKSPASILGTVYFGARRPIAISSRSSGTEFPARRCRRPTCPRLKQSRSSRTSGLSPQRRHSTTGGGSVERGKLVFEDKRCVPDVPSGERRREPPRTGFERHRTASAAIELESSIVDPNAEIFYTNRSYRVVARGWHGRYRPPVECRHVHDSVARHEGAAAIIRQGGPARLWLRGFISHAVVSRTS